MSRTNFRHAVWFVMGLAAWGLNPALAGSPAREDADWIAHNPLRLLDGVMRSAPLGYTPAKMRHAYGVDQVAGDGGNQTIALVDAFGSATIQNDLNVFSTQYNLPQTTIQIVYPQGVPAYPNRGWALETSLDVEWAHAIAPGAKLLLVIPKSGRLTDLILAAGWAASNGASQVSMSWGSSERASETRSDPLFSNPSVNFVASSGDSGAGASWPAASPYVTAVGGTTLRLDTNGHIVSETGWRGSGGGHSRYEPRPSFQNGWHGSSQRGIPDVSYNADPATGVSIYMSGNGSQAGWTTVGGTSAGAPQVAAMLAIANSSRGSPLGKVNPAFYSYAGINYGLYFNDIVSGNNGGFSCTAAYDFVTGLGSPLCNLVIPALITR